MCRHEALLYDLAHYFMVTLEVAAGLHEKIWQSVKGNRQTNTHKTDCSEQQ
jgi:hypothetical protein